MNRPHAYPLGLAVHCPSHVLSSATPREIYNATPCDVLAPYANEMLSLNYHDSSCEYFYEYIYIYIHIYRVCMYIYIYIYIYTHIFFNLYDRIQIVSNNKFASMILGPHANFISYIDYNAARVREIDTSEFK